MKAVVDRSLAWILSQTPYFRGKWRLTNAITKNPRLGVVVAKRRGFEWQLDLGCPIQRNVYYLGWWERAETLFVQRTIRPTWTVVDVGANFGWFSLTFARAVGSNGRVYAFEPATVPFRQLQRNIELNRLTCVHPQQAGLGDKPGHAFIRMSDAESRISQRLWNEAGPGVERVPTTTLDAFMLEQTAPRLDFVKVDIEGGELAFLEGGANALDEFKPILMIEINRLALRSFEVTPERLIQWLERRGYELFTVAPKGLVPITGRMMEREYFNSIAIPQQRLG